MVAIQNKPGILTKKIKMIKNDMCSFCFREKETLKHFYMNVKKCSLRFLSTLSTWLFEFFTFNIVTEKNAFLLGCSENEFLNAINA